MGMSKGRLALAMASVLILVSATLIATISRQDVQSKKQELARLAQENRGLALQLEKAKLSPTQVPIIVNAGDQNEQERLRKKILALNEEMRRSSERAKAIEGQLAALQTQNGSLAGQHQQDQAAISDLQEKLRREKESSTSTMAALLEAQEKIHSLHMAIMQGNERLAMERQLASATSDIRQLMGARNLHIIDVHDVNASGRTNKSFGRVFYAENQSLVFYAFDLPSSKSAKYTFQAWGQTEGNENSIHNLGTFAVDSHEQHRWVLKVNDSAALRDIDSVFVTAETAGDSALPKGKRVLYAYFAPQANHP
ncbi:MAG TPA: hypothetical protein VFA89_03620 [Terriglobales bacterium]|nr:hypothetical protein [Terriglobales bacterium]